MRESFPRKQAGQSIGAGHINKLSKVARRAGTPDQGSHMFGRDGSYANPAPFAQRTFVIVEEEEDSENSSSSSSSSSSQSVSSSSSGSEPSFTPRPQEIYNIKPLYFDHETEEWKRDDDHNSMELDTGGLGLSFAEGDVVVAYWEPQRGAWIPVLGEGGDPWIVFQPDRVCPNVGLSCNCSVSIVKAASCGSGVKIGDEVQVWDFNRNAFNLPEELLFASYGLAHKFKNGFFQFAAPGDTPAGCVWVVTQMFCVNEDQGSGEGS
jgi:hypothetical protein